MEELLKFSFLTEQGDLQIEEHTSAHDPGRERTFSMQQEVALTSAIDPSVSIIVPARDNLRARYHLFISHAQSEASGDVGTLFFLFEQMGVNVWRDMNQTDLTSEGMRQGVFDSDVFIVFLTNSYLSRKFCLLELTWALEFGKPIIIIREEEERFWPFNLERWQQNRCTRIKGGEWTVGGLQTTYETCPPSVRDLIEMRATDGSMLPFRRRDFEANAMTREIVRQASCFPRVVWGSQLPPPAARTTLDAFAQRRICIFALQSPYMKSVMDECKDSINASACQTIWTDDVSSANHVLMVLSKGSVDAGTRSAQLLEEAVLLDKTLTFLYVNSTEASDEAWDFGAFYALHELRPSVATAAVSVHEALKYRETTPASIRYEHDAMTLEVLKRMRVAAEQVPIVPTVVCRQFSRTDPRSLPGVEMPIGT